MSHGCLWVVTEKEPTEARIMEKMLPWHEYESTGIEEYTERVDYTQRVKTRWDELTDKEKKSYNNNILEFAQEENYKITENENGEIEFYDITNPNAKWDWWSIGGRFQNHMRDIYGDCPICSPKNEISLEIPKREKEEENRDKYRKIKAIINDRDIETERDDIIADLEAVYTFFCLIYNLDDFINFTEDEYVAKRSSVCPLAILYDGEWYERGELGYWGVVLDEKDSLDWENIFMNIWNSIPDNYWVTVVDYHI